MGTGRDKVLPSCPRMLLVFKEVVGLPLPLTTSIGVFGRLRLSVSPEGAPLPVTSGLKDKLSPKLTCFMRTLKGIGELGVGGARARGAVDGGAPHPPLAVTASVGRGPAGWGGWSPGALPAHPSPGTPGCCSICSCGAAGTGSGHNHIPESCAPGSRSGYRPGGWEGAERRQT